MKIGIFQICSLLFITCCFSCVKDNQSITVKGHVTYDDLMHTPVKNALISLVICYKTKLYGEGHDDILEMTSTDVNGNYSLSSTVSIPADTYRGYYLVFIDDSYGFYDDRY